MHSGTNNFAATRWTLVLQAGKDDPAGRSALADLCESYWQPVFRFLRSEGRPEDLAGELTQEFFSRILQSGNLSGANPNRGRFRSYLLGAVKHFLQDERDKAQRQKRGSGQVHDPLPDESTAAGGAQLANPTQPPPDAYFDREWALMVLERSLTLLSAEMDTAGKSATFQILKPWLTGTGEVSQGEAARLLNLSAGSVKVAIHRLRQRFREIVRQEIAATVASAEDVNDEVRYLVEVLSST